MFLNVTVKKHCFKLRIKSSSIFGVLKRKKPFNFHLFSIFFSLKEDSQAKREFVAIRDCFEHNCHVIEFRALLRKHSILPI